MPDKALENFRVPRKKGLDKRIKLTDEQRLCIRNLHHKSGVSMRYLSRTFKVSRRLISFVCYPDKLEHNIEVRKHRGSNYYNKERHRRYMSDHRQHKRSLMEKENSNDQ